MAWEVRSFLDASGVSQVAAFFEARNVHGITSVERAKFYAKLELLQEHGLSLLSIGPDLLEALKGETNLYSLRLRTRNNPRVILCALPRRRTLVLLRAFKERDRGDYRSAIVKARRLRDLVVSDPGRWAPP